MKIYFAEHMNIDHLDGIVVTQDHVGTVHKMPWDDFDYNVMFRVFYIYNTERHSLGDVRILIKGVMDTHLVFKERGVSLFEGIYDISHCISSSEVVSLPTELKYYGKLNKAIENRQEEIDLFLQRICDASFYSENKEIYSEWEGADKTIYRDGSTSEAMIQKGRAIAQGRYTPDDSFVFYFDMKEDSFEPIEFCFDRKRALGDTNVNVLIGKNGVGKTHVVKGIIDNIVGLKKVEERYPYFNKLIVAAYSPFEEFYTAKQLIQRMNNSYLRSAVAGSKKTELNRQKPIVNKYAYIGFKDDDGVFNINWPKEHGVHSLLKVLEYDFENNWWNEVMEIEPNLKLLFNTLHLGINFTKIGLPCKEDHQVVWIEEDIELTVGWLADVKEKVDPRKGLIFYNNFEKVSLSSGQEIFSYLIPAIVAELEKESLIILDEPELHLHPNLEVGLMDMLKFLLKKTDSSAIIATHSPLMAREVARDGVTVLRREGTLTQADRPSFETFGASLELIIAEAFEDDLTIKPFQNSLDSAIESSDSPLDVLKEHSKELGDDGVTYILSKLSNKITTTVG